MKDSFLVVLVLFATAVPVSGQLPETYVVPVVAFNQPGYGGNVWSSELVAVNLGPEPSELEFVDFLPGSMTPFDLDGCGRSRWTLDPDEELEAPAGLWLCARSFVGAAIIRVGPWISVRSRIVNHASTIDPRSPSSPPLRGFGQEIPVVQLPEDPPLAGDFLLWPMTWHRNRCGRPRAFDSYVGVVNHGAVPGLIRIGEDGDNAAVIVDGAEVPFGAPIAVPPLTWGQYRLRPYDDEFSDCRGPENLKVRVQTEGPLWAYGSVVDRTSDDPRTVLPVLRPSGSGRPEQ